MEVKIGIQNAAREIVVEVDDTAEAISEQVSAALGDRGVLSLSDTKGRTVVVPGSALAYVDISRGVSGTVGFRSS